MEGSDEVVSEGLDEAAEPYDESSDETPEEHSTVGRYPSWVIEPSRTGTISITIKMAHKF